jgi:ankyrin repeat protein
VPADVNAVTANKISALIIACLHKNTNMAAFLIEAGIDVNAADFEGDTALTRAVQQTNVHIVQLLI